ARRPSLSRDTGPSFRLERRAYLRLCTLGALADKSFGKTWNGPWSCRMRVRPPRPWPSCCRSSQHEVLRSTIPGMATGKAQDAEGGLLPRFSHAKIAPPASNSTTPYVAALRARLAV